MPYKNVCKITFATYKDMFGVNPKEETSPLVKGGHLELDVL
jgi:hypothetical protein